MNSDLCLPQDGVESTISRPQSAGGRLDMSGSDYQKSAVSEPPALATVVATKENVSKESTPRKVSGPPLHLLNLFEPLRSAVSPPKLSTPQHQLQRPMSMIVSSQNELSSSMIPVTSSIAPSATVSSSLSTIASLPSSNENTFHSSSAGLSKNETLNEQDEDDDNADHELEDVVKSYREFETNVPQELDIRRDEMKEHEIANNEESPKQDSTNTRSYNTSLSSEGSENVHIIRVPSHPDLRLRPQLAKVDSLDSSPIMRARSVSQLQNEFEGEGVSLKRRAYSGSRETVPGYTAGLLKDHSHMRRSLDKLRSKGTSTAPPSSSRLPLSHQNSPSKLEKERIGRRISADPEREKVERVLSAGSKGRRPKSMIETGSFLHYRNASMDFALTASQDFISQLFWTSVSLLESDYESEYYLSQHLFGKVISQLDLMSDSTYTRLEMIQQKTKLEKFSGVHKLLLKGLTLISTTKSTRELLSRICPHINRSIFDPSNFKGLPMNIIALLPDLVLHFDKPNESSRNMAGTISKSCSDAIPQAHNSELMAVLKDMGHLFHLYSIQDFTNTRSIWLKSVCHYLSKGYASVSEELLKLLSKMLEYGSDTYHQSVLWIIHEYLVKLEESGLVDLDSLSEVVTGPVSRFIKGPLWQDALLVLTRVIKNSSSLVRPPNSHIAVMDLGIFHQTLPGPTLNFEMDLSSTSKDLPLAHDVSKPMQWTRPQGCQRITRERLLSVINACGPVPVLFSSPSVIFTDEQTLVGPFLESSEEDDEIEDIEEEEEEEMQIPSTKGSTEVLDNSQPESALINSIGDTFDFLNNYKYSDEEEAEEMANVEGPFSSGRDRTYSSSLTSSASSLVSEEEEEEQVGKQPAENQENQDYIENQSANPSSSIPVVGSLEHSMSPKPSSPSSVSVHFVGLDESADSTIIVNPLAETENNLEEEEEDDDGMGEKLAVANEEQSAITEPPLDEEEELQDKETIFDIDITTQVILQSGIQDDDAVSEDLQDSNVEKSLENSQTISITDLESSTDAEILAAENSFEDSLGTIRNDLSSKTEPANERLLMKSRSEDEGSKIVMEEAESAVEYADRHEQKTFKEINTGTNEDYDSQVSHEIDEHHPITEERLIDSDSQPQSIDHHFDLLKKGELDTSEDAEVPDEQHELSIDLDLTDDDDDDDEIASPQGHRVDAHRAAHFISIADEEVEEMWTNHVSNLSRSKSPSQAVNTFYLFHRLFTVYRQQTCSLTEQACNYMIEGFWNISAHFVVTAELMMSQLCLPNVYLDTEAVSRAGIIDRFVFLVLEMHSSSDSLKVKKKLAVENINKCKEFFLSEDSPYTKCLNLCHSIQQLHFHLLIFVGTYTKLLSLVNDSVTTANLTSISTQLTKIMDQLHKAIIHGNRGLCDIPDFETNQLLQSMTEVQALRYLQELVAGEHVQKALLILHAMRSNYRNEHLFGSGQGDDVDVLIFAFAHFIAEGEEGIVGFTSTDFGLSLDDSLSRLMSQNVSLLTLLDNQCDNSHNGGEESTRSSSSES